MNRDVNLTRRVQTSKGLRYCPFVLAANGRVRPDILALIPKSYCSKMYSPGSRFDSE